METESVGQSLSITDNVPAALEPAATVTHAFFLFGPRRKKTCLRGFTNNTGQPVHPRSLISAFIIRILKSTIFNLATGKILMF